MATIDKQLPRCVIEALRQCTKYMVAGFQLNRDLEASSMIFTITFNTDKPKRSPANRPQSTQPANEPERPPTRSDERTTPQPYPQPDPVIIATGPAQHELSEETVQEQTISPPTKAPRIIAPIKTRTHDLPPRVNPANTQASIPTTTQAMDQTSPQHSPSGLPTPVIHCVGQGRSPTPRPAELEWGYNATAKTTTDTTTNQRHQQLLDRAEKLHTDSTITVNILDNFKKLQYRFDNPFQVTVYDPTTEATTTLEQWTPQTLLKFIKKYKRTITLKPTIRQLAAKYIVNIRPRLPDETLQRFHQLMS